MLLPIEQLYQSFPESVKAPKGRDLRNRPLYYPFEKNKPEGKPLDEAFEVTNIPWVITVKEKPNGDTATLAFASGNREREFRQQYKNSFIFS